MLIYTVQLTKNLIFEQFSSQDHSPSPHNLVNKIIKGCLDQFGLQRYPLQVHTVKKERLRKYSTRSLSCNIGKNANTIFKSTIELMHQSIETPTLWVPGKGGGFDIDPSQKASISLPPEAIV